jgi:enoyl-CoA hydratase/carnithine racemase
MTGLTIERRDGAAVITLSNPERRNAFTPDMRRGIVAALMEIAGETETRAVVVRGDGDHFCSGADLSASAPSGSRTYLQHRQYNKEINQLGQAIAAGPKPVIAAVEGNAAGAGMGVACACDVIVAARNARFTPLFTRLGVVPEIGIMHTLALRVGASRARRILMSSKPLGAEEAFEIGLVDELVEPGATLEKALDVAHDYDDCAPLSVALVKEAFAHGVASLAEAARFEVDFIPLITRSDDTREGMSASREKRKPKFSGQ